MPVMLACPCLANLNSNTQVEAVRTFREVLSPYGWVLVCSFLVTAVSTPLVRALAMKFRIVDKPDSFLKPHGHPVAYLGGVAIYLGWLAGLLPVVLAKEQALNRGLGLALAGGVIMLVGVVDDMRNIKPWQKLLGQMSAGIILVVFGIGGSFWHVLLNPMGVEWPDSVIWALSIPTTIFIVIAASNATNLLDGMDGLCSGVTGVIALCFVVLATHLATYSVDDSLVWVKITGSLAMLGAVCGFLPYNTNPATIFMGDAGSMLLGLYAAVMMLLFGNGDTARWLLGAIMIFGLPILDTSLALLRRLRLHRPIFGGDRSHLYDQLVDRGYTVRQTVIICYALSAFYGLVGLAIIFIRIRYALMVYPIVAAMTIYLCYHWGFLKPPVESDQERAAANTPEG
jgi:UDP-GlcNAc:undecaprenyl-phosphate/decaprenyl-phosphate GlcNAc-1-phosphate transferase